MARAPVSKTKVRYVCGECGATAPKWLGKCPDCGAWNTLAEEAAEIGARFGRFGSAGENKPVSLTHDTGEAEGRISTGIGELDRVLGGGIVPGSVVLVGGDPGIGKSTLMLQACHRLARDGGRVLYVSGEESFDQTRMRARRLGALADELMIFTETQVVPVREEIDRGQYEFVVIDSIQSMYAPRLPSTPGSVAQVRECAEELFRAAKVLKVPTFLVGHVTKDGAIAGPRVLEHMVDTVLYFEGDGHQNLRMLRAVKNRFGSTNEIGVFEMTDHGLEEVPNPSSTFLGERPRGTSGSVVASIMEGTRPLLVELQALVSRSVLTVPRRTVTGVSANRVNLILAVLEKRAGLRLSDKDVFVNVAGGVRVDEPAADLAIAVAVASSVGEVPVDPELAVFGEIGLAGEVRSVGQAGKRVAEAGKLGFRKCVLPRGSALRGVSNGIETLLVSRVRDALEIALEK
jgi:DNA repair protein RadA/Sms